MTMAPLRWLAGLACIGGGIALCLWLLLVDGGGHGPALMAHLPPVAFGIALLAAGIWLLRKPGPSARDRPGR